MNLVVKGDRFVVRYGPEMQKAPGRVSDERHCVKRSQERSSVVVEVIVS